MLIFGPATAPRISAVILYRPSSAGLLMTLSSSTTSKAVRFTLEPTSPASVSTVRTSSTAAFSCLPPQRTIAYTENSLSALFGPSVPPAEAGRHHDKGLPALHTAPWDRSAPDPFCAPTTQVIRQPAGLERPAVGRWISERRSRRRSGKAERVRIAELCGRVRTPPVVVWAPRARQPYCRALLAPSRRFPG